MIQNATEFLELRKSKDQEDYLRASNEEAPLSVWYEVLNLYPEMAFWVAQNKTIQYEILEKLAVHPEANVRSMVSMKNKLDESLLMVLSADPDESIRMNVARHKRATRNVLNQLLNDPWHEVSKVVKARLASEGFSS